MKYVGDVGIIHKQIVVNGEKILSYINGREEWTNYVDPKKWKRKNRVVFLWLLYSLDEEDLKRRE